MSAFHSGDKVFFWHTHCPGASGGIVRLVHIRRAAGTPLSDHATHHIVTGNRRLVDARHGRATLDRRGVFAGVVQRTGAVQASAWLE